MKKFTLLYTTLLSLFVLNSCSVKKRVYMPGYHVEWNSQKTNASATAPSTPEQEMENEKVMSEMLTEISPDEHVLSASTEDEIFIPQKQAGFAEAPLAAAPAATEGAAGNVIDVTEKAPTFRDGFKKGVQVMMPQEGTKYHGLAVASLILGVLSLVAYYGAFVLGVLAIIFGAIAMRRIRNNAGYYKGHYMALAGLICGIIGIAIATTIIAL